MEAHGPDESESPPVETSPPSPIVSRIYVAEDLFRRGLAVLTALRESNELRILLAVRGTLQFEIREERTAVSETLAAANLTYDELEGVVWDVSDCLNAAIVGVSEDGFVTARTDTKRFSDGEVEDPEVARLKFRLATEIFDVDELRRRAWVKETSPVRIARRIQWDVLSKHATAVGLPPGNRAVRFGALRFVLDSAQGSLRDQAEFVITVDKEDVGFMIDTLNQLVRALDKEESS